MEEESGGKVNPFRSFRTWFFGHVNPMFGIDPEKTQERATTDDNSPVTKA